MIKRTTLLSLFVLVALLAGCLSRPSITLSPVGSTPPSSLTSGSTEPGTTAPLASESTEPGTIAPSPQTARYFSDAQGMVTVKVDGDEVGLAFDPDNWPDLSGVLDWADYTPSGDGRKTIFYQVEGFSAKVKDVCVGPMWGLLTNNADFDGFIAPTIIFLMDDGSLEWLVADPTWYTEDNEPINSMGKINWLKDIVSLSYETDGEGLGDEKTIFAKDKAGLRYNLKYPCNLQAILYATWRCELRADDGYVAYLYFDEFGEAWLEKGWEDEMAESYLGRYQVYLAEDGKQGQKAGSISLDLAVEWWVWEGEGPIDSPRTIRGSFFAEIEQGDQLVLHLWPLAGDALHKEKGKAMSEYQFIFIDEAGVVDFSSMDDDALVEYLIDAAPEAKALMDEHVLSALVTGETTEFPDGSMGRDVWLGNNNEDAFTREILFTIDASGTIYQYDQVLDMWKIILYVDSP